MVPLRLHPAIADQCFPLLEGVPMELLEFSCEIEAGCFHLKTLLEKCRLDLKVGSKVRSSDIKLD